MALGWKKLLARVVAARKADALDYDWLWQEYRRLASRSDRSEILEILAEAGEGSSQATRMRIAIGVARLLAPLDWPQGWQELRGAVVTAMDVVLRELDPSVQGSISEVVAASGQPDELLMFGRSTFQIARHLLGTPCAREELPLVAALCNNGLRACRRSLRRSLRPFVQQEAYQRNRALREAHVAFMSALQEYRNAVFAFNEELDEPVFKVSRVALELD